MLNWEKRSRSYCLESISGLKSWMSNLAVGGKAEVKSLVSKRSLEVRDLDETVTRKRLLPRYASRWACQTSGTSAGYSLVHNRFGGMQIAVVRLTEEDARSLLGLGGLGWGR